MQPGPRELRDAAPLRPRGLWLQWARSQTKQCIPWTAPDKSCDQWEQAEEPPKRLGAKEDQAEQRKTSEDPDYALDDMLIPWKQRFYHFTAPFLCVCSVRRCLSTIEPDCCEKDSPNVKTRAESFVT